MSEQKLKVVRYQCGVLNATADVAVSDVYTDSHQFGLEHTHSVFVGCAQCNSCGIRRGPDDYDWLACPAWRVMDGGGEL